MDQQSPQATPSPKYVSVRVYVPEKLRNELKSRVSLNGETLSEWFRRVAQAEIDAE